MYSSPVYEIGASLSVFLHFPKWADPLEWSSRHADGLVPDEWPYGFNYLTAALDDVHVARGCPRPGPALNVAWDERTALRNWLSRPRSRWATGVIWATDDAVVGRTSLQMTLLRLFLRHCEFLWVLSAAQVGPLRAWLGENAPPIYYLRFGIDVEFFCPSSSDVTDSATTILSVGNDRDRDQETLYKAFQILMQEEKDYKFLVQSSSEIAPPEGVTTLPRMPASDLRTTYQQSDLVVIATRPNLHVSGMTVALEAQAVGKQVIVTHTPGFEDYVANSDAAHFVPTADPAALAERIGTVLAQYPSGSTIGPGYVKARHSSCGMMTELADRIKYHERRSRP